MATRKKRVKKAAKKTAKRTAKKSRTKTPGSTRRGKKARSPAQAAATKRMIAANKSRKKGRKTSTKKRMTKTRGKKARSPAQIAAGKRLGAMSRARAAKKTRATKAIRKARARRGAFQGPLPQSADVIAARTVQRGARSKGGRRLTYAGLVQDYFRSGAGSDWANVPLSTVVKASKKGRRKSPAAKARAPKQKSVNVGALVKGAEKAAKTSRVAKIAGMKAVWVCGNPVPKYTGCGGGKKPHQGARVLGRLL
jgi:hypothetical protein